MNVLTITWSISDSRLDAFRNDLTGGGLAIKNIANAIGKTENSFLLLGTVALPEMRLDNIQIVGTDKVLNYSRSKETIDQWQSDLLRILADTISDRKIDIVDVHGSGDFCRNCIEYCLKKDIPLVYTDHLFIGESSRFENYESSVEWEKWLYSHQNLNVVSVSHGQKEKIRKFFPDFPAAHITPIPNGTEAIGRIVKSSLVERYSLIGKKVLCCSGTLLERKNQLAAVRAFTLLPKDIQENLAILFCGKDALNGRLQRSIEENQLQDKLIYLGPVPGEKMPAVYTISDGMIMPSFSEGLSLAALEMLSYGKPVVMFRDSECFDDLHDPVAIEIADNRTDEDLSQAIVRWYRKSWNMKAIKEFSSYFNMDRVGADYIRFYKSVLAKKTDQA